MVDFPAIEKKWQKKWDEAKLGLAKKSDLPKFFMHFAYPGVTGQLHVGHMRGYSYTDMICRYKRMTGFNVFYPVGTHPSGNGAISYARKIEKGDEKTISKLKNSGCTDEDIQKMKDPMYFIDYFSNEYIDYWKKYGYICDWNSFTYTAKPDYSKFIQWQFTKLNEKGYLVKEPYIAPFCPKCGAVAIDASQTDLSEGGTAEKAEYTILKFKMGNEFLVAATLRPETIYGQTNLWINPEVDYVRIQVGKETWVCSAQCAKKMANQKDDVKPVAGIVKGTDLIGKYATAPGIEREIIILPSTFTDANMGTGIVTSVPSDAPYDYMALRDLQKDEELMKKYKLDSAKVKAIKIIPIIDSKDYGDTPAVKICNDMGICSQNDANLEKATKIIYSTGFYSGVMNANCGEFAGMPVEKAKDAMKAKLIAAGKADTMSDLSEKVICRCGEEVMLKKIPDQWFIKYSDLNWTEQSKDHAKTMMIKPKDYQDNISGVLDWYQNRACARQGNWIGTKIPFDERWTIEPIADSTLYPAYYVVSRYVTEGKVAKEEMTEQFFDYIFLDKGTPKNAVWKEIRDEFNYWYPVDINLGGKEHQTVHFPPYIMNHTAIMRKQHWPRGIFVNYWLVEEGGKISKSKGGAATTPLGAAEKFSADGMRLYYAHAASPFVDLFWDESAVFSYRKHVENVFLISERLAAMNGTNTSQIDAWMLSKLHSRLKAYRKSMEDYDLRTSIGVVLFELTKDIQHYEKKGGNNKKVAEEVLGAFLKMLTPFIPHTCEECWEMSGHKTLISNEQLAVVDEKKISVEAERSEDLTDTVEDDIANVMKITGMKPKKITLLIAGDWKRNAWKKAIEQSPELLKELMKDNDFKAHGQAAVKYAQWLQKNARELQDIPTSVEEMKAVKAASEHIAKAFSASVEVVSADDSQHPKAGNAIPGKPAILLE